MTPTATTPAALTPMALVPAGMSLAVGLAVLAALLFGTGTALQAHAAERSRTGPRSGSVLPLRGIATVIARPLWMAGTLLDWLGVLVHVAALHFGPLTLVQPLSLSAVVFAVPAESMLARRRPTRRQMAAATETAAGLVVVALFLGRGLRVHHVGAFASAAAVAIAVVVVAALVLSAARCRDHRRRALLLGAAAGSAYGLSDALMRTVQVPAVTGFNSRVEISAAAAALAAGGIGLLLTQAALHRSRLSSSMPAQDLLALLGSIAVGAAMLGEVPPLTGARILATTVALALAGHGIYQLSRTLEQPTRTPPRVLDDTERPDPAVTTQRRTVLLTADTDGSHVAVTAPSIGRQMSRDRAGERSLPFEAGLAARRTTGGSTQRGGVDAGPGG